MADVSDIAIQTALGSWRSGSVSAPEAFSPITNINLKQTLVGAPEVTRSFDFQHDARDDTYDLSTDGAESYATQLTSQEILLDTELTVELYTDEERRLYNGEDFCPYPLVFEGVEVTEETPIPELGADDFYAMCEDVRPTWKVICERVAAELGFGLVIFDGPGLPFNDRKVDGDYTTKGKTAASVLSETLLSTQPRWWGIDDVIYIDGRVLTSGALPTLHFNSLSRRTEREPILPVPVLPTDDPCDDLFETQDNYTLPWSVSEGDDADFSRIQTDFTVTKVGGQVVGETETRYGYFHLLSGDRPWGKYYDMNREYVFIDGCKGAMIEMCETVNEAVLEMTYWDVPVLEDPDIRNRIYQIKDFLPPLLETSVKKIYQRWHAEGWLFSRTEITTEAAAYVVDAAGDPFPGTLPKKRHERSETYIPIGNGIWRINVTEKIPTEIPVYEFDSFSQYTATFPISQTKFYTTLTDQSPPTVTCQPPCGPQTPEDEAQEIFDFEVAKRDAILAMNPDQFIDTLSVPGLLLAYEVGQFKGDAFVSSVAYNVSHESGSASTTVELRRAIV